MWLTIILNEIILNTSVLIKFPFLCVVILVQFSKLLLRSLGHLSAIVLWSVSQATSKGLSHALHMVHMCVVWK